MNMQINTQGRIQDLSERGARWYFRYKKMFELGTKKRASGKIFFD